MEQLTKIQSFQGNVSAALLKAERKLDLASKTSSPLREKLLAYVARSRVYSDYVSSMRITEAGLISPILVKARNDIEQAMVLAKKRVVSVIDVMLLLVTMPQRSHFTWWTLQRSPDFSWFSSSTWEPSKKIP